MTTARRGWAHRGSTPRWRSVRLIVLQRDGWQCQINGPRCTGCADTADHILPLSEGGAMYDLSNLRAACGRCNYGRRDTPTATASSTTIETRTRW